jgi:hypothetical protein
MPARCMSDSTATITRCNEPATVAKRYNKLWAWLNKLHGTGSCHVRAGVKIDPSHRRCGDGVTNEGESERDPKMGPKMEIVTIALKGRGHRVSAEGGSCLVDTGLADSRLD